MEGVFYEQRLPARKEAVFSVFSAAAAAAVYMKESVLAAVYRASAAPLVLGGEAAPVQKARLAAAQVVEVSTERLAVPVLTARLAASMEGVSAAPSVLTWEAAPALKARLAAAQVVEVSTERLAVPVLTARLAAAQVIEVSTECLAALETLPVLAPSAIGVATARWAPSYSARTQN